MILDSCQIEQIEDGTFDGLHNLKKLDLCGNPIKEITANLFFGLNNLKELNFEECKIESNIRMINVSNIFQWNRENTEFRLDSIMWKFKIS